MNLSLSPKVEPSGDQLLNQLEVQQKHAYSSKEDSA